MDHRTSKSARRGPLLLAVAATALLAAACVTPEAPPTTGTTPPGVPTLAVSEVAGGLDRPWDLAFTPDGAMLATERVGRIVEIDGGVKQVLAAPADVLAQGEGGMLGLAVDPGFATNRRIYTCMVSTAGPGTDVRLVRWQVDPGYTTLTNRTDIVTGIPVSASNPGRHSGCRPRFGPDGHLWVTTGDAVTGSVPQDPTSLGGKVLRVTTDGAGAPGNPGGALRPEIYTLGHRNPQGVSFRADGSAFAVEHGTGCDDEINKLVAGGNYGWNPVPSGGGTGYVENAPMTDPLVGGAIGAVWSSGCPTIAPSGATFLSGSQWEDWDGALASAVLKAQQLFVVQLDPSGTTVTETFTALTGYGRLRSAVQGPDGNLYIATDAQPGSILRVVPS